jgi:hypothetical protein
MKLIISILVINTVLLFTGPKALAVRKLAQKAGIDDILNENTFDLISKAKRKFNSSLTKIPYLGKIFDTTAEKIDLIYERQTKSMKALKKIFNNTSATKTHIEELTTTKKRSFQTAKEIVNSLKIKHFNKIPKILGGIEGEAIEIPINPAVYMPQNSVTNKMKNNLENDLSLKGGVTNTKHFLLKDSIRDLVYKLNEQNTNPFRKKGLEQELKKSANYDNALIKAIHAKKLARAKLYSAMIKQLKQDIKNLKKIKDPSKLNAKAILQLESVIDAKQKRCNELNEKIDKIIEDSLKLSDEEKENLTIYYAHNEINNWLKEIVKKKK